MVKYDNTNKEKNRIWKVYSFQKSKNDNVNFYQMASKLKHLVC